MAPGELIPYANNAKQHPPEQIDRIAASLERFGFRQPILVDRDNVVVVGHGRLMAALKMGLDKVPVCRADDMSEEDVNAYRLADNKTNESAWDFGKLEEELAQLAIDGIDMSQFGFDDVESAFDNVNDIVEDEAPEVQEEAVSKLGQIYQLGEHRLMVGDSTDPEQIDQLLNGEFMRMTVTSPPYGVGKDYEEAGIEPWRKTIGGVINAIKGKSLIICWNIADLFCTGTQFTEPTGA